MSAEPTHEQLAARMDRKSLIEGIATFARMEQKPEVAARRAAYQAALATLDTAPQADGPEASHIPLTGDTDAAMAFLKAWPTKRVHLWFKKTDKVTGEEGVNQGRTYERTEEGYAKMRAALDAAQDKFGCYFHINDVLDGIDLAAKNPATGRPYGKASNSQIARVVAFHVDIDCEEGETAAAIQERIFSATKQKGTPPFYGMSNDSGSGGQHLFWPLSEPIEIDGDPAKADDIGLYNLALAKFFGGDTVARDVSRVLRVPGTINLPNKAKRAKGRVPGLAKVIKFSDERFDLADFKKAAADKKPAGKKTSKKTKAAALGKRNNEPGRRSCASNLQNRRP